MVVTTPVTHGHIDQFRLHNDGEAQLSGWIFREDIPVDRVDISLGGKPWVRAVPLAERPDVRSAYEPAIGPCPHSSHCAFHVTASLPQGVEPDCRTIITITPYAQDGRQLDQFLTYFCSYEEELRATTLPPVHLQERIGGTKDYLRIGTELASLILTCVAKHRPISAIDAILDWGCGSGRVIRQLAKLIAPGKLFGCDVDTEAINWDQENILGPQFKRINPYPPTPYPNDKFDVIYGISVMTHLDEETQLLWLEELKRIARPGGIVALSVIGQNLRSERMPASLAQEFSKNGFASFVPDYSNSLTEFSHENYYKEAYHSPDYIVSRWGRYFSVAEYVETKHQDIVILRKT